MSGLRRLCAALGLVVACAGVLSGQEIKSNFESGDDGWTCSNARVERRGSGGNPGGYLFADNNESDIVWCSAPQTFLGNLLGFNGGRFSFDGNLVLEAARYWSELEAIPYGGNYGTVRIRSPGGTVSRDLKVGKPDQGVWTTYSISMTSTAWGVSEEQWTSILSSVSSIEINLEALYGEEQEGLDNVILSGTGGELTITKPGSLYDSAVGKNWSVFSRAIGGRKPYTWSFEGSLPPGVSMSSDYAGDDGKLWEGQLTQAGTFDFTFVVTDANGATAKRAYQLKVSAAETLNLTLRNNDNAIFGLPEDEIWVLQGMPVNGSELSSRYRFTATGGVPPYKYSWDLSSLFVLETSGDVGGTAGKGDFPTEATVPVTAQVKDSSGQLATRKVLVRVLLPPEVTDPRELPDGRVGELYQFQVHHRYGGDPAHIGWAPDPLGVYPLPSWLKVDSKTGLLTGTPPAAGKYEFGVYLQNDKFPSAKGYRVFELNVAAAEPPGNGPKLNTSHVSCEAVKQGAPGATEPVTSTGGDQGVDASGAAPWLKVPQQVAPTPGSNRPSFSTFGCDPAGMPPGDFQTSVKVEGKEMKVYFHIDEPAPSIEYAPGHETIHLVKPSGKGFLKSSFRLNLGSLPDKRIVTVDTPKFTQKISTTGTVQTGKALTTALELNDSDVPGGDHVATTVRAEVEGLGIFSIPLEIFRIEPSVPEVRPAGFVSTFPNGQGTGHQTLFLHNPGSKAMEWSASSKGPTGAAVSPSSGSLAPGETQAVNVTVQPPSGGLPVSSGSIEVKSRDGLRGVGFIAEEPRGLRMRFSTAALPFYSGLLFGDGIGNSAKPALRTADGGDSMLTVTLTNVANSSQNFACHVPAGSGFTVQPVSGALAGGGSADLRVTAAQPGGAIAESDLVCQVGEVVSRVHLTAFPAASACSANRLLVLPETPAPNLAMEAGKMYPIQTLVVDNCGKPVTGAFVTLFGNQRSMVLSEAGGGRYIGEWTASTPGTKPLTLSASADALAGEALLYPMVLPDPDDVPRLESAAPRGAAGFGANFTPAAGSFLTLFGTGLTSNAVPASTIPLPTSLGDTTVTLGGRPMPLHYVSPGQINALVLYDLPVGVPMELVVERGNLRSAPLTVTLGDAAPDMFTFPDGDVVRGIVLDANFQLVTSANPLKRGGVGILLASGLGNVSPELASGAQTANDIRVIAGQPSLRIGGREAQILFAGLLPGFAGAYQVNFVVPDAIDPGTSTVVLAVNGKESNQTLTEIQ